MHNLRKENVTGTLESICPTFDLEVQAGPPGLTFLPVRRCLGSIIRCCSSRMGAGAGWQIGRSPWMDNLGILSQLVSEGRGLRSLSRMTGLHYSHNALGGQEPDTALYFHHHTASLKINILVWFIADHCPCCPGFLGGLNVKHLGRCPAPGLPTPSTYSYSFLPGQVSGLDSDAQSSRRA